MAASCAPVAAIPVTVATPPRAPPVGAALTAKVTSRSSTGNAAIAVSMMHSPLTHACTPWDWPITDRPMKYTNAAAGLRNTNASNQPATFGNHNRLPRLNWPAAATGNITVNTNTAPSRNSITTYCTPPTINANVAQNATSAGEPPCEGSIAASRSPRSRAGTAANNPAARACAHSWIARTTGIDPAAVIENTSRPRAMSRTQPWEEPATPQVTAARIATTATVTAPDQQGLRAEVADLEQAAGASQVRLRRLYELQAAGFYVGLPAGLSLTELARMWTR